VAVMAVVVMVVAVAAVATIMGAIVKSVTNVTKSVISLANARKMLIVVIVAMGLVTLLEIAARVRMNHLAIHATELVIWPVIALTLRLVEVVVVVVVAIVIVETVVIAVAIETMIGLCLVTLVTRVVTFHATVQMAPSHVTTVATRGISVVNAPKMVAETKKYNIHNASINHFS